MVKFEIERAAPDTKNTLSRSSVGGWEYSQMPNYAASITVARPVTDFFKKKNFLICTHVVKKVAREAKMLGKVRKYFQSWDMTFEQFERQVNMLNFRQVHSSNELWVDIFTIGKLSASDRFKWKLCEIYSAYERFRFQRHALLETAGESSMRHGMCVKLDEREPEKSVVVSFIRFLGICDFVNDFLSKPVVKAGQDKVGSSVGQNDVETCCLCLDNVEDIVLRTECSSGKCPLCLDRCSSKACQWYVMTDIPTHFDAAENFVQLSYCLELKLGFSIFPSEIVSFICDEVVFLVDR
ncbi:conserved hypothetical protein [Trichinella spiralis]|uniref:hypothetical protein n=1 Tax=Trichinella spiralis TaxID=6334 RepID=UPI0001EFC75F|nr:conserved hypothetical protein [Trichinella spiralis]